ncbi:MAG: hypothetical protein IT236_19140, partial [Bacteroidia bacterium]|nr:hypothetical protein [Bacteroidia bacterium]
MKTLPTILFCNSPFNDADVDPDYQEEYDAAKKNGFNTALISYENLILPTNNQQVAKKLFAAEQATPILYRGWMLTNEQYAQLYKELKSKNYYLINSPEEYRNCHYLPDSLKYIHAKTARTIYQKFEGEDSIQQLMKEAAVFGNNAIIIKDYVKSEKHDWDTACYVPDASNKEKL